MALRAAFALLVPVAFLGPERPEGKEYQVDLGAENRVRFISDAPLESFEGHTSRIDGFVFLGGDGTGSPADLVLSELHFEVDLASLDTGIGLRNRHMRENYLETDRFPFASYSGRLVDLGADDAGGFRARARGELSIHGESRSREIACRIRPLEPGDSGPPWSGSLRVGCTFSVALPDHEIPIPRLMFMKINEVVELELDFHLAPAALGQKGTAGGWSTAG